MSRTWVAALLIAAFGVHLVAFLGYAPGDVYFYVRPWYRELLVHGLSRPVSNYSPPYIYLLWLLTIFDGLVWQVVLIKLLSLVGALWLAIAARRLLQSLDAPTEFGWLVFGLPSVILDTSLLGQADLFWVSPCVLAASAAINRKLDRVAFWSGLAFAFKLQAAFFAPFVLYLFVSERSPLRTWLIAPLVFMAAMLPAFLAGWPLTHLAAIYIGQVQSVNNRGFFIGDSASWWTAFGYIAPTAAHNLRWLGIPLIIAALVGYWRSLPGKLDKQQLMRAAIVSAGGVPFLLPTMLDRFFILADVLAFLYALAWPSRRSAAAAILIQLGSAFPIFVWAFSLHPLDGFGAPFMLGGLALVMRDGEGIARASLSHVKLFRRSTQDDGISQQDIAKARDHAEKPQQSDWQCEPFGEGPLA